MLTLVPPNECMQAREALSARLDGELAELDGARLDAHLRVCPECRAYAADVTGLTGRLRAADLAPAPAGLFAPRERRRRSAGPFAAAAASLVIAAATGASFVLGQVVGRGAGGSAMTTTSAAAATSGDPGVLAMLQAERSGRGTSGRVIAL